jgi:hypothetical protein
MTKKILNYFFIASIALSFVGIANTRVFAEGDAAPAEEGAVDLGFKLDNPLSSEVDTLPEFLYEIIHIFLIVGVPIVALAIIYCGFLFVIARGNSEKLSEAKKALGYTLLGAAILLGAFVISNIIQSTVDDIQDATVRIFDESELA